MVAIFDLLEERRINDVSLINFSFLWVLIVASDILALRLCATLLSSQYFDVTCDLLRRLSKDDTKQDYYWLKEEKYTCCSCNTNFRAFLYRTSQNNDVKSPNFRYLRQREHITMKQSFSVLTLRPFVPSYSIIRPYCSR